VCYCHDCRAFVHWLKRDDLLDAHGGTDLVQLARARLEIIEGSSEIRCMRLSSKGLHRWYADCCRTPLGNTIPRIPYIGIVRSVFELPAANEISTFGPTSALNVRSAVGGPPPARPVLRGAAHVILLLAGWALRGLGHPTPLFDRENRPTVTPRVLTAEERQTLRDHSRA
jgi:hypothetical protein